MQRLLKKCVYWVAAVLAKMAGGGHTMGKFLSFRRYRILSSFEFLFEFIIFKKKKRLFFSSCWSSSTWYFNNTSYRIGSYRSVPLPVLL